MALQDRVHHRECVILEVILVEYRQTFARSQFNGSLVGFQLAADGFQQRGLSCTIGTDDTIDITCCELDVYVFVKHSLAELNRQIRNCYHICLIPYYNIIGLQR